ncbi:MAG: tetratricopeptide repeat protein, partial [Tepidisphaeraceae bacterium]
EAEPLLREAVSIRREKLGPRAAPTTRTAGALAGLLDQTNRHTEAVALRGEYGLPAPATQAATQRVTSPATIPASR